jgi:CheY-like chemotaxis protein
MTFDPSLPPPTVLIVDDDAVVRRVVQGHLSDAGYRIFEAEDGREALEVLERIGSVDLIITDVVMPGISGRELAQQLLHIGHRARILYMSGYADIAIGRHGVVDANTPFLQKPFTPDALSRKVKEVLARH